MNLATKLNIDGLDMYRPMSSLSGGQKKRVALTAALLLQPDVLLLDEVIMATKCHLLFVP